MTTPENKLQISIDPQVANSIILNARAVDLLPSLLSESEKLGAQSGRYEIEQLILTILRVLAENKTLLATFKEPLITSAQLNKVSEWLNIQVSSLTPEEKADLLERVESWFHAKLPKLKELIESHKPNSEMQLSQEEARSILMSLVQLAGDLFPLDVVNQHLFALGIKPTAETRDAWMHVTLTWAEYHFVSNPITLDLNGSRNPQNRKTKKATKLLKQAMIQTNLGQVVSKIVEVVGWYPIVTPTTEEGFRSLLELPVGSNMQLLEKQESMRYEWMRNLFDKALNAYRKGSEALETFINELDSKDKTHLLESLDSGYGFSKKRPLVRKLLEIMDDIPEDTRWRLETRLELDKIVDAIINLDLNDLKEVELVRQKIQNLYVDVTEENFQEEEGIRMRLLAGHVPTYLRSRLKVLGFTHAYHNEFGKRISFITKLDPETTKKYLMAGQVAQRLSKLSDANDAQKADFISYFEEAISDPEVCKILWGSLWPGGITKFVNTWQIPDFNIYDVLEKLGIERTDSGFLIKGAKHKTPNKPQI